MNKHMVFDKGAYDYLQRMLDSFKNLVITTASSIANEKITIDDINRSLSESLHEFYWDQE